MFGGGFRHHVNFKLINELYLPKSQPLIPGME